MVEGELDSLAAILTDQEYQLGDIESGLVQSTR